MLPFLNETAVSSLRPKIYTAETLSCNNDASELKSKCDPFVSKRLAADPRYDQRHLQLTFDVKILARRSPAVATDVVKPEMTRHPTAEHTCQV